MQGPFKKHSYAYIDISVGLSANKNSGNSELMGRDWIKHLFN